MDKDIIAHIRFKREDYLLIKQKAKKLGLTVSAFVRMKVISNESFERI